jgi:hypothetical protein
MAQTILKKENVMEALILIAAAKYGIVVLTLSATIICTIYGWAITS